jgi:hypothetical protein
MVETSPNRATAAAYRNAHAARGATLRAFWRWAVHRP